jgi:lysophospholipase L1-like esterase
MREKSRRVLQYSALLAVSIAIAGLIGERILRKKIPPPLPQPEPQVRYIPHPVRGFTLRPSQNAFTYDVPVRIDSAGYRSNGRAPVADTNAIRILALGDSYTFGLGVRDSATWPAQLEARLAASGVPVRVLNAGTIAYGVFQEMDLLRERVRRVRPRIVIHALYWNDYQVAHEPRPGDPILITPDGRFTWDVPPTAEPLLQRAGRRIRESSVLVRAIWHRITGAPSDYARAHQQLVQGQLDSVEWRPVETFYRDLRELAQKEHFETFVIIMPVYDLVTRVQPASSRYAIFARTMLAGLGMAYLDGFTLWQSHGLGAETFLPQGPDAHLNEAGYRALVDSLIPALMSDSAIGPHLRGARGHQNSAAKSPP